MCKANHADTMPLSALVQPCSFFMLSIDEEAPESQISGYIFSESVMIPAPSRAQTKRATLLKLLGDIESLEANLKVQFPTSLPCHNLQCV